MLASLSRVQTSAFTDMLGGGIRAFSSSLASKRSEVRSSTLHESIEWLRSCLCLSPRRSLLQAEVLQANVDTKKEWRATRGEDVFHGMCEQLGPLLVDWPQNHHRNFA